jgi:hypothetical protein
MTRGKARNENWHLVRNWRITASQAGPLCQLFHASQQSGSRNAAQLGKELRQLANTLSSGPVNPTPAMQWGQDHEEEALAQYADKYMGADEEMVVGSGIHIHPQYNFLGGSPDGVVKTRVPASGKRKATTRTMFRLVEVKCPHSARDPRMRLGEDVCTYLTRTSGKWELNMKDATAMKYYWQCQINMAILNIQLADLVVWTPHEMAVIRIERLPPYDEIAVLMNLQNTWEEHVRPSTERMTKDCPFIRVNTDPGHLSRMTKQARNTLFELERCLDDYAPVTTKRKKGSYPPEIIKTMREVSGYESTHMYGGQ